MKLLIAYPTSRGPAFIGQSVDGRYHPIWKGDSLGSYADIAGAIGDLAGGHTFTPSDGTDTASLGISDDQGDWLPAKDFT